MSKIFVVMGVSGCGKSTIASELAKKSGGIFLEGDEFHPAHNVAKMAAGHPLTDEDRLPWLQSLNEKLTSLEEKSQAVFLSCSALRESYRTLLADGLNSLKFIYLQGTREVLLKRMMQRKNHFMPAALLDSQLATLEEPSNAVVVNIDQPVKDILSQVLPQI